MKNTIATITSSRSLTLAIAALISAVAGGPAQAATIDWNPPTVGGGGSTAWATGGVPYLTAVGEFSRSGYGTRQGDLQP